MYKLNLSFMIILLPFFFFIVSCGSGGISSVSPSVSPSVEFNHFVDANRKKSPEEFVTWWNNTERYNGWTFSYYGKNGLVWPDNSTAEEIFTSKIVNCYRMTVLLQSIYGGEPVYLYQPTSNYDHVVLLLYSNDEKGYIMISYPNGGSPETCKYQVLNTGNREEALRRIEECFPGASVVDKEDFRG